MDPEPYCRPAAHPGRGAGAAFLVVLLLAALLAAPAQADRYEEGDPAGDMARGVRGAPAPDARLLDIRHVIVRHTDHFVSVRAYVRSLVRPRGDESYYLMGFVKVSERARPWESAAWTYEVEFDRRRPREGDRAFILDAEHQEEVGCSSFSDPGLRARANYDRDRVTLLIPRRCLRPSDPGGVRPRWIRATVSTLGPRFYDHLGPRARFFPSDQFSSSHVRWLTPRLYPG